MNLPYNWANWAEREKCRYAGGSFLCWAEPVPEDPSEERYAVAKDSNDAIRWWRFSPNPEVTVQQSSGAFYGDQYKEDAIKAALTHKKLSRASTT